MLFIEAGVMHEDPGGSGDESIFVIWASKLSAAGLAYQNSRLTLMLRDPPAFRKGRSDFSRHPTVVALVARSARTDRPEI